MYTIRHVEAQRLRIARPTMLDWLLLPFAMLLLGGAFLSPKRKREKALSSGVEGSRRQEESAEQPPVDVAHSAYRRCGAVRRCCRRPAAVRPRGGCSSG